MKRLRNRLLFAGSLVALAAAIPAFSQQTPESLLPPGFGEPKTPPAPPPDPAAPPAEPAPLLPVPGISEAETIIEDAAQEDLEALEEQRVEPIELPEASRRQVEVVGVLDAGNWGLGSDAFAGASGRFMSTLMRRIDAPLPSRWASILLRRALLSRTPAPRNVNPVDWVAERAWLLLRMGEADAARMLVQAIDVDRFTPKMYQVAVQTGLATADPAAICPLVSGGRELSNEAVWDLAEAMCAALEGDAGRASALIDQARRRGRARGIDLTLAEKVVGAGTDTRRAVTVEWEGVEKLSAWRFGLASATGLEIPAALMNGGGRHIRAWQARAPMIPIEQRLDAADTAASLGVFSSASLVEMYSLIHDTTDPSDLAESVGGRLRQAYIARDPARRMEAIRDLWDDARTSQARDARLILTATAAARIEPSKAFEEDAANLIASMLSAGYDAHAARWSGVVAGLDGPAGDRAWSLLVLSSPRLRGRVNGTRIEAFRNRDKTEEKQKSKLLVAALAGLGRIDPAVASRLARGMDLQLGRQNAWTRAIDLAASGGRRGPVVLLAAAGLQTGAWEGVPPVHLFHILRALREVGFDYEARLIAAEAMARL